MTTVTWSSDVVGNWYAPANWSHNHVPVAGDTAVVTAGSAELLSDIDPASGMTLLLGGPTAIDMAGGAAANAWVYTFNNVIGPGFTIADTTPGYEGVLATAGITEFSGSIVVTGANALLGIGVDTAAPTVVKNGLEGAIGNVVSNPSDIGQFQNGGTISVSGGAGLLITPLNTLDNGQVSMLIGTIDLDDGTLASTYVTLGPPNGGFGTSGVINMAHGSTALMQLATNIDANFVDGTGNRLIFTSTNQTVVISGFQYGDEIEQTPQSIFGTTTPYGNDGLSYNTATHVLQITTGVGGTPFLEYTLAGTYTQNQFNAADDANGNLVITLACFAAGTRIATDRGEVAVEALVVGDRVATARKAGATFREVRWIGYRHVDLLGHPDPAAVRPIRILAGAFDGALPRRDLLLSPDHAVFQGGDGAAPGVLIPVRYLVNGATILPDHDLDAVTYFHVELATHEVLLAEGLPAESYLDTGNRRQFTNGGTVAALRSLGQVQRRSWGKPNDVAKS